LASAFPLILFLNNIEGRTYETSDFFERQSIFIEDGEATAVKEMESMPGLKTELREMLE
jgi:hypothetical protein